MQQLLLDFPHNKQYFKEDFITTEANQIAYDYITNWPENWGVNPYKYAIIISGPAGCGKTHLAHIWQRESKAYFISPNEDLSVKLSHYESFILEDIDNKIWDETYLFHIFNQLHEAKKYALFTTQLRPVEISFILADLKSRLNSLFSLNITCPSDELMKIMLLKHFSERELKVSLDVVNYLASRIPRTFSEVTNIVDLLDKTALLQKRNITIPLVKDVLNI
ncbi:MAG: hda [Rickettsiaceae bacterium]|jgi:chromosomal replication initiation ATPase DnaA|nr:hda [Rickettsiaceae bacterium]